MSPSFANRRLAADAFEARIENAIVRPDDLYDLDGETFLRRCGGQVEPALRKPSTGRPRNGLPAAQVPPCPGHCHPRFLEDPREAWDAIELKNRVGDFMDIHRDEQREGGQP